MAAITDEQIRSLIDMVGRDGAIAALTSTRSFSAKDLLDQARRLGINASSRGSKRETARAIVRQVDKRINKTLQELKRMSKDEIVRYFEDIGCDEDELIELLTSIDFKARARSRKALLEFAAIQISSLGIFERLADGSR